MTDFATPTAGAPSPPRPTRRRRRRAAATLLVLGLVGLVAPNVVQPVDAEHVAPVFVPGNPTCGELGDSDLELRVGPVEDGVYTDGTLTVTIDVRDTSAGQVFDFTANIPVESVFAKGGPNGNLYVYNPSVTSDTGLHAPVNDSNGRYYGLSHISFCYSPVPSTVLTVTANPTLVNTQGGMVTFTISETNDGALSLTNPHVVTDSAACNAALSAPTGDTNGNTRLDPGETWVWTCTIEVTGSSADNFTLVATGHGTDPLGRDVTWCADPASPPAGVFCDQQERDDVTVEIFEPSTVLTVTADPTVIRSGDSVTFTIRETNDGEKALTNPSVVTDSTACNAALSAPTGDTNGNGELDPGETWVWTCTIPVVGDISTDFTLTAIGHGTDPTGDDVTWCANPASPPAGVFCDQHERNSVGVDIISPTTVLSVTASATEVEPGDTVTFTIAETNDSIDAPLTNVSVETSSADCDAALSGPTGDTNGNNVLDPGETWTWTCTIAVPGPAGTTFTLTATGHGTDPIGLDVTWCADLTNPPAGVACDQDERDSVPVDVREVGEGFTPGYWKNHPASWAPTGYSPGQTLESVFDVPDAYGLDSVTLIQALSLAGGGGTTGAARTLMRAAVAALLNASHPNVDYPRTTAEVIADVNAALASGNRTTMLALAGQLDADNNLGGDISS